MTPTKQHSQTPHGATGLVAMLGGLLRAKGTGASKSAIGVLVPVTTVLASLALVPASAGAYASIEGPPKFSAAPGLPDGRIYEQVSPADKNGNQAGASTTSYDAGANGHYGFASADGNAVLFEGTGPMGESPSGSSQWFVATKNTGAPGWSTRSLLPAEQLGRLGDPLGGQYVDPAPDLSHAVIGGEDLIHSEANFCPLVLTGPDPFVGATSLERAAIENPVERCGRNEGVPDGGTPDFSTVYFTYAGTLLPEDESRELHAASGKIEGGEAWGFYENREGVLREAGILPADSPYPGGVDPFGTVPAASGHGRNPSGNQVSADGSRAFFVSPDPASCTTTGGQNNCALDPPELYVRENGERTQLVSRDTLLPEAGGLPAAAPGGVSRMPNPAEQLNGYPFNGSYVFASPDGSQAFFQSDDALTEPAQEASPGSEPKTYDFDVDTGTLTYLPGVVLGEILGTDDDGSSLAFLRPAAGTSPAEIDLWTAGPGGGSVTPVTQLPEPSAGVREARMSSDGSAFVFQTASRISTAFNSGGEEIYRYDVPAATLGCVSCAPAGVPSGGGSISRSILALGHETVGVMFDERGVSADGDRVFFETATPLVPQDQNTNATVLCEQASAFCGQGQDVYEWENGVVYLISTGKSPYDSYLLNSSENGDDVFFATTDGLVPGDTDDGYDVYDARVPHPGEPYPPAAVPCEGAVCQGPPNVPSPLTPPASATFTGLGNPTTEVTPPPVKTVTKKTVKCAKGKKLSHSKCVKKSKSKKAKKASTKRGPKS